jgi:GNAT superfamily N-acetyltransferase
MSSEDLDKEIAAGVSFYGYEADGFLVGVMGIQPVKDVDLIRHAYVRPFAQRLGVGAALLEWIRKLSSRPLLVGTWAAASWAIRFYERNGFVLVPADETKAVLRKYWAIPEHQLRTSVVLVHPSR